MTDEVRFEARATPDDLKFETVPRPRQDLLTQERDEHVWIAAAIYRVTPEAMRESVATGESMHLDMENLAVVEARCWVCEQSFSTRLSYRKCPGEPRR